MAPSTLIGQPVWETRDCSGASEIAWCYPKGFAFDNGGNLYVADQFYSRVLKLIAPATTDLVPDCVFGQLGSFTDSIVNKQATATANGTPSARGLNRPQELEVGADGQLYVVDKNNTRILIFSGTTSDEDCDAFQDAQQTNHLGSSNTDSSKDNCPSVRNTDQVNRDGNFVDNSPPLSASNDDKTWPDSDAVGDLCDADDDNDGISDADELSGAACGGVITNPLDPDSDSDNNADGIDNTDRVLDGAECQLGTDPTDYTSKPTAAQCGSTTDTDGDGLSDGVEFCGYNTNPNNTDTDGDRTLDGAKDGCEAASLNGDRVVNSGDQLLMIIEINRVATPSQRLVSYDINKDGAVNSGDQLILSQFISPSGQCP